MNVLTIAMPGNESYASRLSEELGVGKCQWQYKRFPDGESYIRLESDVRNKTLLVVWSMFRPDKLFLGFSFLCSALRQAGAQKIILLAPYLAYMRQDKAFKKGELVTSSLFAGMLSEYIDGIVTIDPHLHRIKSLDEIYNCDSHVLHSKDLIAKWIQNHVSNPVLIGPDAESRQWVARVADQYEWPYSVLNKTRMGDRSVKISMGDLSSFKDHTAVIIDDIVSTGHTMMNCATLLVSNEFKKPVCIAVHPVMSDNAWQEIQKSEIGLFISCDTIPHISNTISTACLFADAFKQYGSA